MEERRGVVPFGEAWVGVIHWKKNNMNSNVQLGRLSFTPARRMFKASSIRDCTRALFGGESWSSVDACARPAKCSGVSNWATGRGDTAEVLGSGLAGGGDAFGLGVGGGDGGALMVG